MRTGESALQLSKYTRSIDLGGISFVDLPGEANAYDNHENCHHAPVAREWSKARKRTTAVVACINASCIGLLLGMYAGEVPALQYVIIDMNHNIILGNVVMYLGLAISSMIFWPLPLLHGRKPYTVAGYVLGLCFQVPQGIVAGAIRLPDNTLWLVLLLVFRGLSGIALGLCDINVQATLLDLFGASLQSHHPHQELPDPYDFRRHGGGLGLWLGVWSWCSIGPISIGFMIGAFIIDQASAVWGFWVGVIVLMAALLVNVMVPEVRRAAFRRTLEEWKARDGTTSRVGRGEIKMHLDSTGPSWWGQEIMAGLRLCSMMMQQAGFVLLSVYTSWVYAQFTLILVLLGALASASYRLRPVSVGLCVLSLGLGALLATPFQKASWLSRARWRSPTTASMTMKKERLTWSSHLARRAIFTILLPVVAIIFAVTSTGPPISIVVPCLMAFCIGLFSAMAVAECIGLLYENFDTSDLQPRFHSGWPHQSVVQRCGDYKTNFSCYPRISAGLAIIQCSKYCLAAVATGVGGRLERRLGAVQAAASVAGLLLAITLLLTIVLFRWKAVQIVPDWQLAQDKESAGGRGEDAVVLGNPRSTTRKISLLEAGKLTRWSAIRQHNLRSARSTLVKASQA